MRFFQLFSYRASVLHRVWIGISYFFGRLVLLSENLVESQELKGFLLILLCFESLCSLRQSVALAFSLTPSFSFIAYKLEKIIFVLRSTYAFRWFYNY